MIIDDLKNIKYCSKFSPIIKEALSFIKTNLSTFEERHYDINEYMFAVLQTSLPKLIPEQKLEIPKRYVDLQYVIEGYDVIDWKNLLNCKQVYKNYQLSRDISFYGDKTDFDTVLNQGSFVIFFSQDAHATLCSKFPVKKYILKIAVEKFVSIWRTKNDNWFNRFLLFR